VAVAENDLAARYAGSRLGRAWFVISPLFLLAIYSTIYLFVFNVRPVGMLPSQYVLHVFAGIAPYLAIAESITAGTSSLIGVSRSTLASTVFPMELIPARPVMASLAHLVFGLGFVMIGSLFVSGPQLSWLALPLVVVCHVLGAVGVVWILSIVNPLIRDLQHGLNFLLMTLMIASPIGYTAEMAPPALRPFLFLNPLGLLISSYQSILVGGVVPEAPKLVLLFVEAAAFFLIGSFVFARGRRIVVDYV
jgi:lipopolysaccharide transport system permease protein